jgi:mRNA degradation ribonuclease J1/J2
VPRRLSGCKDYFEFDLLPRIEGIYSKEMLKGTDLKYCEPKINGVFLSHAHFDHKLLYIDKTEANHPQLIKTRNLKLLNDEFYQL